MRDKLVIIGASGHGKVIADIARLNGYHEIVFLDDDKSKNKNGIYDVIGTSKDIEVYKKEYDYNEERILKAMLQELKERGIINEYNNG